MQGLSNMAHENAIMQGPLCFPAQIWLLPGLFTLRYQIEELVSSIFVARRIEDGEHMQKVDD
jgi:hypothetical protein